ncbi:phosphonate metabolism protein/1,5-bisphosphokinase (PRPP-forming) PhnN [Mesobacterium pallidum]|uniref:phosphonate metabolism protein/1,5-bisphosphokinase (PRPP-forming) PhnN n=1 Tax=Mesobacterium pallidum TaxID=2872037 RepID=UPI001EE36348|nr:phosphonate metabolism protein/1,5-bisphosphokinase (PRPP-forming) PhnN [Mesobacterium pallidum]
MSAGRLIAVVGPSGVGKDSVIAGIMAARPDLRLVRRVITRAPELGGEEYVPATVAEFEAMAARGAFCIRWGAHGLYYGIPAWTVTAVQEGAECLANFSRGALDEAARIFPRLKVLHITATPETLARRLANRGRESEAEIAARLTRSTDPLPEGLDVTEIPNDGTLDAAVALALAALQPVRA